MRIVLVLALLLVGALAGCTDEPAPEPQDTKPEKVGGRPIGNDPGEPTAPSTPADQHPSQSFNTSKNVYLSRTTFMAGGIYLLDANCAYVRSGSQWLADTVKITATWTPENPTLEELQLTIRGPDSREALQGTSPIVLEINDFGLFEADEALDAYITIPEAGSSISQQIELDFEIQYRGTDLQVDDGGCG